MRKHCCPATHVDSRTIYVSKKKMILIGEKVRRDIQTFLEDDENSRQSPGKKDTITKKKVKKQRRYLGLIFSMIPWAIFIKSIL